MSEKEEYKTFIERVYIKDKVVYYDYKTYVKPTNAETSSLKGLSLNEKEYFYERDTRGVINRIIDKNGTILIEYKYDDWGKPTWTTNNTSEANELLELNPFMYKGYFYDQNTGLYYLNTRYYDPELGRFINADKEVGTVQNIMGMNLYAYCRCNPISYADENGTWPQWLTKVCIGIAVIGVCALVAAATAGTGVACIGMSMLVGAAKGAAIGAVTGALTGAVIGAVTEGIKTGTWEGALKGAISGAVNVAADGFMFGAIGGAVSGAMNPKYCFVAGTLVMTSEGLKAIETIKEGELVLSYNSNLGIYEYKDVVEVYKNTTKELCHIFTDKEEIICTPNHNILTNNGWKKAGDITSNDYIQTTTDFEKVKIVQLEQSEESINVYNLNVLCYHTYVIGNSLFIVHNICKLGRNMEKSGNLRPDRHHDAHHIFPQGFREKFDFKHIDIDNPKYGIWLDASIHRKGAYAYNEAWEGVIKNIKGIDDALEYASQFMKDIYKIII